MLSFFSALNAIHPLLPETQAALMKSMQVKELRRGQVWLQEGAVCDKITFVVKGLLKLYFESGAKEVVMQFAKEDDWMVAANSYFEREPSHYTIRCVEPSFIIYFTKTDFDQLLERHIELNILFKLIAEKQMRQYEAHTALLMLSLRERYENLLTQNSWMVCSGRITDRLLAAYLGMTANSLCGIKKK